MLGLFFLHRNFSRISVTKSDAHLARRVESVSGEVTLAERWRQLE